MTRLEPPAHYDDERRQVWADTLARLTSSGRVFRADPEILNTYVEAVRSHRQASRLLSQSNVLLTRDGRAVENPALSVQRRSAEAMTRASRALGLDRAPLAGDPSMTAGDPAPVRDGKCGGPKRQGGGTCGQAAGWGTPHPGSGRCKLHGGCSPSHVTAGLNEQAARELARLDVEPVGNPLEELGRLAAQAVAWKDAMAGKVNELNGRLRYESENGGEQLRAEILLWERALDRCVMTLTAIVKLNIEGRLASVREATADMLDQALQAALASSGCDVDGQQRAREAFRRHLKVVA